MNQAIGIALKALRKNNGVKANLLTLAEELGIGKENILSTLLKMPDVIASTNEVLIDEEKEAIFGLLKQAIDLLNMQVINLH